MFNLPGSAPEPRTTTPLPAGKHRVRLTGIRMVQSVGKVVVNYEDANGAGFDDWLGFNTDSQSKRSYAYLCRIHELGGLPVPKGKVDDAALLAALANTELWIELVGTPGHDGRVFLDLADFPVAVGNAHAQVADGEPLLF